MNTVLRLHSKALILLGACGALAGALEAGLLVSIAHLATAIAAGETKHISLGGRPWPLKGVIGITLALVGVRLALQLATAFLRGRLTFTFLETFRRRYVASLLEAPWEAKMQLAASESLSLMSTNLQYGMEALSAFVIGIGFALNLCIFFAISVALYGPVAGVGVVFAGGGLFMLFRPLGSAARRLATDYSASVSTFSARLLAACSLLREVELFRVRKSVAAWLQDSNEAAATSQFWSMTLLASLPGFYQAVVMSGVVAVLGFVATGEQQVEKLASVALLAVRALSYGQGLQAAYQRFCTNAPYVDEVITEIDALQSATVAQGSQCSKVHTGAKLGWLTLTDVSYVYPNSDSPTLAGLSVRLEIGTVVGLVGGSGTGKTTLIHLLLGLLQPTEGTVRFETTNGQQAAVEVGFVAQEPALFDGTVADNVRFFRRCDPTEIQRCTSLAALRDDIATLERQFDYEVGPEGRRLSGGQRQRVSIARALVNDAQILVLDEPSSALDEESEVELLTSIRRIKEESQKLIIIVSHRPRLLEACDTVYTLDSTGLRETRNPRR